MRKKGFMTIGYGNMKIKDFIAKLKSLRVNCIVDVRTRPYSTYNVPFNKEELREKLQNEGLSYFWFGNKLGGRYDKIKYCDSQGRVDYEKVAASEGFIEGIKELEKGIDKYNICVMCSEKDPLKCHRFLLISRALKEYNIYHIMPDGTLMKNSELEQKMFKMNSNLNQLSIFEKDNEESFEVKAYRVQGLNTSYVSEKVKQLLSQGITEDVESKIRIFGIGTEGKITDDILDLIKAKGIKRVIDVRDCMTKDKNPFPMFMDISYYLHGKDIEYEIIPDLLPIMHNAEKAKGKSRAKYMREYLAQIKENGSIESLFSEELDGTCFLGYEKDYMKCHRQVIIKELKKRNSNIIVRHLK